MTSHEEIQAQIPAYAARRLEPEAARRLEEHLADCESCREVAATAAEIAGVIREGGEALFDPHPRELTLRRYAGGDPLPEERARIERHLAWCATCRLEAEAWKSATAAPRPSGVAAGRTAGGRGRVGGSGRWVPSLSAALGLAVGAALVVMFLRLPQPPAPVSPDGTGRLTSTESWEGDSPLYLLPPLERGGGAAAVPTWSLWKGDSHLSVGVQPVLPAELADGKICRLELLREDGGAAWSMEMTAGRMREHLATPAGVVHFTLPTAGLVPGLYEFRIVPVSDPPVPPIYRVRIRIAAAR